MTNPQSRASTWHEIILATLKANDVKLVVYVPDRVFTPLIKAIHADSFFTTFAATREEEALGIVVDTPVDLLLTDLVMPKTSGLELAEQARAIVPGLKVLFMSGYSHDAVSQSRQVSPALFIQKPASPDGLASKVRAVLEGAVQ